MTGNETTEARSDLFCFFSVRKTKYNEKFLKVPKIE